MLYHLALASDWDAAQVAGDYRVSTLGVPLERVGFIHTSFADQVAGVAQRFYAEVAAPLVLLHIEESRLTSPWRVDPVAGSTRGFPHVYGPIDLTAIVAATAVRRAVDGAWQGLPGDPADPPG